MCPRISSIITKRNPAEPKLVSDRAAIDLDRLTGNECAGGRGEKDSGTTELVRRRVAFDHSRVDRMRPDLLHHGGMIEDAFVGGEAGQDGVRADIVGGKLGRYRTPHLRRIVLRV
jgi:hypothetical protein